MFGVVSREIGMELELTPTTGTVMTVSGIRRKINPFGSFMLESTMKEGLFLTVKKTKTKKQY